MDKSKINELYKRFDAARSEMDKASRALATALNTPENCRIISKKTRSAFRKGRDSVKSIDLWDERMMYDLFNMLMLLDILDGTWEDPADEIEIYEEEIVEAVEPEVETYVAPELDVDTVDEMLEVDAIVEDAIVEEPVYVAPPAYVPPAYVAPEPVVEVETPKSSYQSQESSYESASSSYDDSSSSYDSGGSDD